MKTTGGIDNARVLCDSLQVKRIGELEMAPGGGRAAHIHRGRPGENGPVVANLAWPQNSQAADCLDARLRPAPAPPRQVPRAFNSATRLFSSP